MSSATFTYLSSPRCGGAGPWQPYRLRTHRLRLMSEYHRNASRPLFHTLYPVPPSARGRIHQHETGDRHCGCVGRLARRWLSDWLQLERVQSCQLLEDWNCHQRGRVSGRAIWGGCALGVGWSESDCGERWHRWTLASHIVPLSTFWCVRFCLHNVLPSDHWSS